jgi:hypothetical protein
VFVFFVEAVRICRREAGADMPARGGPDMPARGGADMPARPPHAHGAVDDGAVVALWRSVHTARVLGPLAAGVVSWVLIKGALADEL